MQNQKKYAIIYKRLKEIQFNRGVAQLVARVVWDHEVAGSIPVTSTTNYNRLLKNGWFIFLYKNSHFSHISVLWTLFLNR